MIPIILPSAVRPRSNPGAVCFLPRKGRNRQTTGARLIGEIDYAVGRAPTNAQLS